MGPARQACLGVKLTRFSMWLQSSPKWKKEQDTTDSSEDGIFPPTSIQKTYKHF